MSRRTKARKNAWAKELNHRELVASYMNARRDGLIASINNADISQDDRDRLIASLGAPLDVNHLGELVDSFGWEQMMFSST